MLDKPHLELMCFNENPNLGVFCRANDSVIFVPKGLPKKIKERIALVLDVNIVELTIADATIIGSLLTFNSNGAVVTNFIDDDAVRIIKDQGLDIYVINDKLNAAGNDILVNDCGALVHPDFEDKSLNEIDVGLAVGAYSYNYPPDSTYSPIYKAEDLRRRIKRGECFCPLANASYTNMLLNFETLCRASWNFVKLR